MAKGLLPDDDDVKRRNGIGIMRRARRIVAHCFVLKWCDDDANIVMYTRRLTLFSLQFKVKSCDHQQVNETESETGMCEVFMMSNCIYCIYDV
jgi:hypothetical protein